MVYTYLVVVDINEQDYVNIHRHEPGTAADLIRDEIISDLESCPEPNEITVTLVSTRRRRHEEVAAYDINNDPRD